MNHILPITQIRDAIARVPRHLLSASGRDDLVIHHYSDGTVVIHISPATEPGANTIALSPRHLGPVCRALRAIDEGRSRCKP